MKRKQIYTITAFVTLILVCLVLFFLRDTDNPSELRLLDKPNVSGEGELQAVNEEVRSVSHDKKAVYNSKLNQDRRQVAASKALVEDANKESRLRVKIDAVVQSGETLVTMESNDSEGGVLVTALTVTLEKMDGGPDVVRLAVKCFTSGADFVELNDMGDFQGDTKGNEQYVEAWSEDQYREVQARSVPRKDNDVMTLPSILTRSSEAASMAALDADGLNMLKLEVTPVIQEDGSIHIRSEFIIGSFGE